MRKRERAADDESHSPTYDQGNTEEPLDTLKRAKTVNPTDDLPLIPPERAWKIDLGDIINSSHHRSASGERENYRSSPARPSCFILCVIGQLDIHYHLLHAMLPELLSMSPNLQALILQSGPPPHFLVPSSTNFPLPMSLPFLNASDLASPIFLRLGLLHPLGGGKTPMDALVLIDGQGRRRLVVPIGWGAGKHVGEWAYGNVVMQRLMEALREGVLGLEKERVEMEKGEDIMIE
ncbi:hypothetical protein LTS18_008194 [Coniosporium uncinatum]|uniref:Uncharacterized protein n=1 Tax=Coniosporium uncinatum TaxID=93489 RepID=A0ACC3D283_9PEZI|nr:hypothetical protein LTS18_008194 [Coniosporium uncinatum]